MKAAELDQLHAAIMRGSTDSDVDHWRGTCSTAIRMCQRLGVEYAVNGSGTAGPYRSPTDPGPFVLEQLGARWTVKADDRPRTLGEMIAQVQACVGAVVAAPEPTGGTVTTPSTPSAPQTATWPPPAASWWASWESSASYAKKFKDAPWNYQSASPRVVSGACRFEFPSGGGQNPGPGASRNNDGGRRCEIEPTLSVASGKTHWIRWDWTLVNFPTQTTEWNVLWQLKGDGGGSPPLSLEVNAGRYRIVVHNSSGGRTATHAFGKAAQGARTSLIFGITYGTSGRVVALQDGVEVLNTAAATLHSGKGHYWKTGLYASQALSGPLCLDMHAMAAGDSRAAVSQ